MFNKAAPAGSEYLLIRARADYLKGPAGKTLDINTFYFDVVTSDGRVVNKFSSFVVAPKPELDGQVYVGGFVDGWAVFTLPSGDPNPVLAYGRNYRGEGGVWLALK